MTSSPSARRHAHVVDRSPCPLPDALLDDELVAMTRQIGLAERLYPVFFAAIRGGVDDLHAAWHGDDRATAARLAHRLRGSSAQVGALRLAQALGDLEEALAGGDLGGAAVALDGLAALADASITALQEALAAHPA